MKEKLKAFWESRVWIVFTFAALAAMAVWTYFNGGRDDINWAAYHALWAYILAWFCFFKVWAIERYLRKKFPPRSEIDQKVLDNLRKRNG